MKYIPDLAFLTIILFLSIQVNGQDHSTNFKPERLIKIDSILYQHFSKNAPGATIAIAQNGEIVYEKGFGLANLEFKVEMRPEMIFRIGSLTKQITAGAILLLAEKGMIDLKQSISTYLPEYPSKSNSITIENLLTHTSGIPNIPKIPEDRGKTEYDIWSSSEILSLFQDLPLNFKPGDKMSYSNSGYDVLGAIIEKVSGMSYEDFVRDEIFDKLDMAHTFYDHPLEVVMNNVQGYEKDSSNYKLAKYTSMSIPYSAGGLRSSLSDLVKWNNALVSYHFVDSAIVKKIFSPFILNSNQESNYGYGWFLNSFLGNKTYYHTGSINGFRSSSFYFPDSQYQIVVLTNNTSYDPEYITFIISEILLNHEVKDNRMNPLSTKELKKYAGNFKFNSNNFEIKVDSLGLYFNSNRVNGRMIATDHRNFFIEGTIFSCEFMQNQSSKEVNEFILRHRFWGDEWFSAKRIN